MGSDIKVYYLLFIYYILIVGVNSALFGLISPIEVVEEWGCHDTEIRLTCGKLDSKIAILEATFIPNCTDLESNCVASSSAGDDERLLFAKIQSASKNNKRRLDETEAGRKFLETLREKDKEEENQQSELDENLEEEILDTAKVERSSLRASIERLLIEYLKLAPDSNGNGNDIDDVNDSYRNRRNLNNLSILNNINNLANISTKLNQITNYTEELFEYDNELNNITANLLTEDDSILVDSIGDKGDGSFIDESVFDSAYYDIIEQEKQDRFNNKVQIGARNITVSENIKYDNEMNVNRNKNKNVNKNKQNGAMCSERKRRIGQLDRFVIEKSYEKDDETEHNIRMNLNYRCSGKNHCSFVFAIDHPLGVVWTSGIVRIKYICMEDFRINKYCAEHLVIGNEVQKRQQQRRANRRKPDVALNSDNLMHEDYDGPKAEARISNEANFHQFTNLKILKPSTDELPPEQQPTKAANEENVHKERKRKKPNMYSQDFRLLKILPANLDDFNDIERIGNEFYFKKDENLDENGILPTDVQTTTGLPVATFQPKLPLYPLSTMETVSRLDDIVRKEQDEVSIGSIEGNVVDNILDETESMTTLLSVKSTVPSFLNRLINSTEASTATQIFDDNLPTTQNFSLTDYGTLIVDDNENVVIYPTKFNNFTTPLNNEGKIVDTTTSPMINQINNTQLDSNKKNRTSLFWPTLAPTLSFVDVLHNNRKNKSGFRFTHPRWDDYDDSNGNVLEMFINETIRLANEDETVNEFDEEIDDDDDYDDDDNDKNERLSSESIYTQNAKLFKSTVIGNIKATKGYSDMNVDDAIDEDEEDESNEDDFITDDKSGRRTYTSIQRTALKRPLLHGFAMSPGYPKFYIGESECKWTITAPYRQKIRVTILDISLRYDEVCRDYIEIVDIQHRRVLFSSCTENSKPIEIISEANELQVTVKTASKVAYPKRGVLIHYSALGCLTPTAPSHVQLVVRTEKTAKYKCDPAYVFPDTAAPSRELHCTLRHTWDKSLPDCIVKEATVGSGIVSRYDQKKEVTMVDNYSTDMVYDVLIPSLIIAGLFIVNGIVFLIIMRYRNKRKQRLELVEQKELAEL